MKLYTARIDKITPDDTKGPYYFISLDGETYLEVEEIPEDRVAVIDDLMVELERRTGPLHFRMHRRLLEYGHAEFKEIV